MTDDLTPEAAEQQGEMDAEEAIQAYVRSIGRIYEETQDRYAPVCQGLRCVPSTLSHLITIWR